MGGRIMAKINLGRVVGAKGDKGDKGEQGETGSQGLKGEKGDNGANGLKGDKGDAFVYEDFTQEQLNSLKGDKGEKGDKGDTTKFQDISNLAGGAGTKYIRLIKFDYAGASQGNGIFMISGGTSIGDNKMSLYTIRISTRNFETPNVDKSMAYITNLGEVNTNFYLVPKNDKVELWIESASYGYDINVACLSDNHGFVVDIGDKVATLPSEALLLDVVANIKDVTYTKVQVDSKKWNMTSINGLTTALEGLASQDHVDQEVQAIQQSVINNSSAIEQINLDLATLRSELEAMKPSS